MTVSLRKRWTSKKWSNKTDLEETQGSLKVVPWDKPQKWLIRIDDEHGKLVKTLSDTDCCMEEGWISASDMEVPHFWVCEYGTEEEATQKAIKRVNDFRQTEEGKGAISYAQDRESERVHRELDAKQANENKPATTGDINRLIETIKEYRNESDNKNNL